MAPKKSIKVIKRSDWERLQQESGPSTSVKLTEREIRRLAATKIENWVKEFRAGKQASN